METDRTRYYALDDIRGITLISMIFYHAMWDIVFILGKDIKWYNEAPGYIWQQSIGWTFILLSGFCWQLGRHRLKRSITVFMAGLLVTAVTLLAMPQNRVIFGVLTFIGSAMLIMIPLDTFLRKCKAGVGLALSLALFFISRDINSGWIGFESIRLVKVPQFFYDNLFTTYLGFPNRGFFSTDYYSLFPWLFLFMAGYFLYNILEKSGFLKSLSKSIFPGVGILGRFSLIIYMVHQPLIYLVILMIS